LSATHPVISHENSDSGLTPTIFYDRVKGVLLGMIAGEKNGGPTCMALELASSLCELGYFSTEDVLKRYLDWWQIDGFDAGFISPQVFSLIIDGESPSVSIDT
jgi:hypothetical protein